MIMRAVPWIGVLAGYTHVYAASATLPFTLTVDFNFYWLYYTTLHS
jgi:hypothetical protein